MNTGYVQEVPLTDALHHAPRGNCSERHRGFYCTLALDHRGPHVAHIGPYAAICAWTTLDPDLETDEGL